MSRFMDLPSMHSVVSAAEAQRPVELFGRPALVESVRETLRGFRDGRTAGASLVAALRRLPTPIIGRIQDGAVMLDLRCLENADAFITQMRRLRESLAGADRR